MNPGRASFKCELHPNEKFNGFCPSCLYDRLATLNPNPNSSSSSSSVFRRTKSVSNFNNPIIHSHFEPPRHSCQNSTDQFPINHNLPLQIANNFNVTLPHHIRAHFHNKAQNIRVSENLGDQISLPLQTLVHQNRLFQNNVRANENLGDQIRAQFDNRSSEIRVSDDLGDQIRVDKIRAQFDNGGSEIRQFGEKNRVSEIEPIEETRVPIETGNIVSNQVRAFEELINRNKGQRINRNVGGEIKPFEKPIANNEIEEEIVVDDETKKMSEFIEIDFQAKNKKNSSVGFWSAASVFSKKLNKWMKKQKCKKQKAAEKPIPRQTQSEVADYGFGRRSCDVDPRYAVDIGRLSIDGPRSSFDPPRASWDGHMIRRNNFPNHRVSIPGDTVQTQQYYLDTSSRRRKSFDKWGVNNEVDEMKAMGSTSNARVTPESFDFHQRKSNSNSLRDECSEIFELGIRDNNSVIGNLEERDSSKGRRWGKKWSLWGLINGRSSKNVEDDRYSRQEGFDRSSSVRGDIRGETNGNVHRRTSSVSENVRNQSVGENGYGRQRRDNFSLERNRSVDNGLLRFYLTPPRSNGRNSKSKKSSKTDSSHPVPKGVFRY